MRYRAEGLDGLKERSRAPIRHGLSREEELVAAALGLRERQPTWGPKKLPRKLSERWPVSVWWIKLGVKPERIDPGKPQQNGRHERLHRTLKEDAVSPPAATLSDQQRAFDAFRAVYNHERPHEALDFATPASLYCASPRAYPCALREPDYPDEAAVRRVRTNGAIKWAGDLVFISEVLIGEPVAVEETEQGERRVRYADVELGFIDKSGRLRRRKLEKPRRACGLVDNAARCPQGPQAGQQQQQPAT